MITVVCNSVLSTGCTSQKGRKAMEKYETNRLQKFKGGADASINAIAENLKTKRGEGFFMCTRPSVAHFPFTQTYITLLLFILYFLSLF